ncbi:tRNA (adenosine(37)-N6)-dimethylallyltransferase MiaA [Candidatus Xianfuyuplasma coldseepsis]|uniref:tRNA dimethylallyltransferase n=1 Tax=Candidatus Xianfuyuplasma coldseepsis TaxID=2782163 RepID=A0A7L7KSD7_9MOLU|nr:tRNA (adenosine(37)-N6)-dimethylallyltransferase MiaA [Xianfuyuplasma coldseepsis]QMS85653.1 tRNA (adenosine(37)-N6)-dimethylallyltransferase MiaA [Xianfuyuplasma coldseepsis]
MIIAIVGPTGVGKTALSIALAQELHTEIISGDSIQVYRGMDIGSAKITPEEMAGIPHHLLDILDPKEEFSVAVFQSMVRDKITDFQKRELTPLIVGGTGLYIKSVLYDYDFTDAKRDPDLAAQYESCSNEELYAQLEIKDKKATNKIHPNNRKRVIQALIRSDTNKVGDNTNKDVPLYDFIIIGLKLDRQTLYQRINDRVDQMMEMGLEEEMKHLYHKGLSKTAKQAIGYKEWIPYLNGTATKEEVVEAIKQHSRNLAKKQYTFFEHQFPVHWIDVDTQQFDNTIQNALELLRKEGVL